MSAEQLGTFLEAIDCMARRTKSGSGIIREKLQSLCSNNKAMLYSIENLLEPDYPRAGDPQEDPRPIQDSLKVLLFTAKISDGDDSVKSLINNVCFGTIIKKNLEMAIGRM